MEQIELLQSALEFEGMAFGPKTIRYFSIYQEILLEWNKKINLISRRDETRIVTRHFLQSLGLVKVITIPPKARVMDLGSGAGFPGLPVKLMRPDLRMVLVESKRKKVHFLRVLKETLLLEDIEIVLGRIEALEDVIGCVDFVISRAVTDLVTLAKWSKAYLVPNGGKLISIKGPDVVKELDALKKVASDMAIERIRLFDYNPFPQIFQLKQSKLVSVAW